MKEKGAGDGVSPAHLACFSYEATPGGKAASLHPSWPGLGGPGLEFEIGAVSA